MSTQELVTSIIAEQEESTDQFVDILQQKIEDAIEVKRIELASQMFAEASKKCPECGKTECECDDEEEYDMEEMDEEFEQIDEKVMVGDKVKIHYKGSQAHGMVGRVEDIYPDEGGTHAKVRISKGTSTSVPIGSLKRHKKVSEEVEQDSGEFVIRKGVRGEGSNSSDLQGTHHGVNVKPVYTSRKEAQDHADKINRGRGYDPERDKNRALTRGVLYQVFPRRKSMEEETIPEESREKSYITAATKRYVKDRKSIDDAAPHGNDSTADPKLKRSVDNRFKGLLRAAKKLNKEEVEQIDEALGNDIRKHVNAVKSGNKEEASKILDRILKKHGPAAVKHAKTYTNRELKEAEQMDEQFTLHAVHDEMGTKKKLGSFASKGEAAAHLNKLEKAGKFPEGHEAVLTDKNGQKHMYTDKWEQMDEMAPPGAKYERMVKHIKKAYSKGGLTKNEKSIAYATAWKAKNREMSEAAMTDAQQMAALGLKGAERAKMMMAVSAYRKHGDINKLSPGHRSLVSGYMEKTGGLGVVNRNTALQALKKERMQEE